MTLLSRSLKARRLPGLILIFLFLNLSLPILSPPLAQSASPQQQACEGSGGKWSGSKCQNNTSNGPSVPKTVENAINILLFVVGAAAVIVIVVQGLRFVSSNGDPQAVSKAKNGIIFALVGLAVAAIAYAIVNFILNQL